MSYFKLEHKLKEIKEFAENGLTDLKDTGIASLNTLIKLKKGYPIFVGGAPFSGKTEFTFELLVNQSILHKWKHFIYCGEGGNVEHIFYELLFKYLRKPYKYAEESDKIKAEYFISEYFVICDHDSDYTIDSFYDLVQRAEDEFNIKFDTTLFDPFNDINEEDEKFKGAQHKFIQSALKKCRIVSKKHNRIDILVTHIADIKVEKDKDSGKNFERPAFPNEWAGGRTWWRRGFLMILVYRPPTFLKDDNGRPYEENETIIWVQKAKPKGIGKTGKVSIYFEWKQNVYYSYDETGQKLYSCETNNFKPLQPSTDFTISKREQLEDYIDPF